jgi:sarcosine oxidase, subunit delta
MILLPCAWCGPRDAAEFHHLGEAVPRPDPATTTPEEWRAYLYERDNPCGWVTETWYHRMGCRRVLTLHRHTLTNEVTPTPPVEPTTPGDREEEAAAAAAAAHTARPPLASGEAGR